MTILRTSDFDYNLPEQLIAKYPLPNRSDSRLLVMDRNKKAISHTKFTHLVDFIDENDLLVFNNTKVIPARLFGRKQSGGKVAALIERILSATTALAHLKSSKSPAIGSELLFADCLIATVIGREDDLFVLEFKTEIPILNLLEQYGEIPLPPYMEREAESLDQSRYQTIFAKYQGAVAAPTAALHFDENTFEKIAEKGIETGFVTLHIGAGTFQPVRVDKLTEHQMHKEYLEVSETLCDQVKACKTRGGRVIAIGTTVVRCLETATQQGEINPYQGDTDLFIYPGYQFHCVDSLLSNFHLPKSTLLMLICAFAGYKETLAAYHDAVRESYRFFSYGDAMLVI